MRLQVVSTFLSILFVPLGLHAQLPTPVASKDLMRLIRSEKFEVILPRVMRDNQIDMWIHMKGAEDPLNFELGDSPGAYIFTDRGDDRIERAVLAGAPMRRFTTSSVPRAISQSLSRNAIPSASP